MAKKPERGLGRGLSALMADINTDAGDVNANAAASSDDKSVPIERVRPNPLQPRRDFDETALNELADSIRERGIIQPIIVRVDPKDAKLFQIIAGERRWRAAQIAKVHSIPVITREMSDKEVLEVAIIENIQRADLNAVEEALGYRALMDTHGHTQEQVSAALGKSRSHIANVLRLLNLPKDVQKFLREGQLTAGHARALITAEDPSTLARIVIKKSLSVRQTESLAKQGLSEKPSTSSAPKIKDADTLALEASLSAQLKMKTVINHADGKENGTVSVSYRDLDQLEKLVALLSSNH